MNYITEILILLFLAVTFLQSGYDKIIDWKGNVGWLKSHFANTFLGDKVPFSLGIILILEIIAGILAFIKSVSFFSSYLKVNAVVVKSLRDPSLFE